MQTRLIFSLYSLVTLKIRSRSPKSNQIFQPSQQYMKFGLNPSFGSRDRVQISFFGQKLKISKCMVTLKMKSRSSKSNHFFPPSQ